MVVREAAAAVDARRGDAVDVARMHAVVDLPVAPVVLAGSDASLEIDDAQIHAGTIQFRQRIAPDVIELHRPRDRAVDTLGAFHVGAGVADVGFVQPGIVGMRQDLIDPAARHHVAAEEKADRVRPRYLSQRFDQRTYFILRRLFQPRLRRRVRAVHDLARSSRSMTSASLIWLKSSYDAPTP